jgi:Putative Ig domain
LLFRKDIVTTFSGETLRKLRVLSSVVVGILVWAMVFAGCSGGSNSLTITLTPASGQSLNPGDTATITATVANDSTNGGVTWTLSGPGTLSDNTKTTVVYTAPTSISVTTTATITATSVANSSINTTESITVNAVLTITTGSLPAATLNVPYNAFVNAAGAPAPFTWSVTSGSLPAGLSFLTSSTSTSAQITGTPTLLGTSKFSVQVSDTSGTSVTQALSITVNTPPPLSVVTGSLPAGTVNTPYSQTLQANSGVPPYTWSITGGVLPVGLSLSPVGVISGTPIATGTSSFTVQVVDSSTPAPQTASANLSITINPGVTNNSRLSGHYAFSVRGFDPNGLFVAAGSFLADGQGNISAGIADINNTTASSLSQAFTGTYSIGQDGLGFMTFNMTAGGSRTFALSVMANGSANIIEFDDSTGGGTRNSGVLLKQTTSAFSEPLIPNSNYALGLLGIDSNQNRFGLAGSFQTDGGGGFTNGLLDSDDSSTGPSPSLLFTGGYTVASASNGRGTAFINTAQGTTGYSFYVVTSSQLLIMETDTFSTQGFPLVSGTILQQSTNSFTNGYLSGASVFEVTGLDASTAESQVGLFTGDAGGNFSLTSDQNSGGTLTSPVGTGSYGVATNGRVSLALLTGTGFQNSQPVLYLVTANEGFIIGTDSAVSFGFMSAQSGPFTDASLSGTYAGGSLAPVDQSISNVVSIAIAGSANFSVTADVSGANGLSQNQASAGIGSVATNGRVAITLNTTTVDLLYLITSGQFVALSTDPTARVDIFSQ